MNTPILRLANIRSCTLLITLAAMAILLQSCAEGPVRKTHSPYEEPQTTAPEKDDFIKEVQTLYQRGDFSEALSRLDSTPEKNIHPNDRPEYHNLRGLILLGQKKPLQAEASFRRAMNLNQTSEFAGYFKYNFATSLSDQGKRSEALAALNEIDLPAVDQAQRKKVLTLKEKLMNAEAGDAAGKKPTKIEVIGSPSSGTQSSGAPNSSNEKTETGATGVAISDSTTINIPEPTQTFAGPVNKMRIGLLIPLSGKYESFGKKAQRAVELAFQHSGDPRAKEYEIVAEDAGDTVNSRLEALQKLVEEKQVIAIIGPLVTKGLETLTARAAYYQVPMISIAQAQGITSPLLFSCAISNRDQASRIADYAMRVKGYSRFAILAPSNKPGEEMAHSFWDEIEARKGSVTAFELYNPEVTDFREPVDKSIGLYYTEARSKEVRELADKRKEMNITKKTMKTGQYFELPPIVDFDAVFIADEAKTVGQIIPTYAYRNAKNIPFLGMTSWNSLQLIQRAQEQAEGATFPVAFNTLTPPPSTKNFYDLYVATYTAYPGELDALAFDSAALVLKTLHSSPSSRTDFRRELEKVKNVEGATGEVSMVDHHCSRKLDLYTVQKGKFVTVSE